MSTTARRDLNEHAVVQDVLLLETTHLPAAIMAAKLLDYVTSTWVFTHKVGAVVDNMIDHNP